MINFYESFEECFEHGQSGAFRRECEEWDCVRAFDGKSQVKEDETLSHEWNVRWVPLIWAWIIDDKR